MMKKLLCVLLVLTLLFGLAATAGAEFFDEKNFSDQRRTAIDYAAGKRIITGYPDRNFKPNLVLTRAQAAKILCVALEGEEQANAVKAGESGFDDVPA